MCVTGFVAIEVCDPAVPGNAASSLFARMRGLAECAAAARPNAGESACLS
ncbi:MAG: hypothetical protein KGM43_16930 [Planctomycetota bacterium]|nr:hypothetical protein [Planctomycetota bacterium]